MKRVRIGNYFNFTWELNRGNAPEQLSRASNFALTLYKKIYGRGGVQVPYTISGNAIKIAFPPQIADICANYYIKISYILDGKEMKRDVAAFQVVPRTFLADDVYDVKIITNLLSEQTGIEIVDAPEMNPKSTTVKRVRIGNTFLYEWEITRSGEREDFTTARDIKIYQFRNKFGDSKTELLDYTIYNGVVAILVTDDIATSTGVYYYELHYEIDDRELGVRACVADITAFQVVERTSHADELYRISAAHVGGGLVELLYMSSNVTPSDYNVLSSVRTIHIINRVVDTASSQLNRRIDGVAASLGNQITDVASQSHSHSNKDVLDLFKKDKKGNVYLDQNFYSKGSIASYKDGESGEPLDEVLWQNVIGRPTKLSEFINDIGGGGRTGTVIQRKYKTQPTKPAKPIGEALDWDDEPIPEQNTELGVVGANLYDKQYLINQGWDDKPLYAFTERTGKGNLVVSGIINPSKFKANKQYRCNINSGTYANSATIVVNYSDGSNYVHYAGRPFIFDTEEEKTVSSINIVLEQGYSSSYVEIHYDTEIYELGVSGSTNIPIWVTKRTVVDGVAGEWSDPVEWDGTIPVDPGNPSGDVYWANVINRPTDLSQFANSPKYQTLSEVSTLIANAQLGGGTVNLDNYYTKPLTDTLLLAKLNKNTYDVFIDKFNSMFALDTSGNIKALKNLYSTGSIASYMDGESGQLLNEVLWQNVLGRPNMADYTTEQKVNQLIANAQLGGGGGEVDLTAYYLKTESDDKFALKTAIANKSNWDTAYGWGNHGSQGYLTSSAIANKSNWDTAFGWGNHALENYLIADDIVGKLDKSIYEAFISKFDSMFELDTNGNIKALKNFYSIESIASYKEGAESAIFQFGRYKIGIDTNNRMAIYVDNIQVAYIAANGTYTKI